MTPSLPLFIQRIPAPRTATMALTFSLVVLAATHASAQVQEGRMEEILHADRSRTSEFAGKTFASSASIGGKRAETRSFAFSHSAVLRSGDGSFRAHSYSNTDQFRTGSFATKADRASGSDAFVAADRGFAVKALPVNEAPAANKSAAVRKYTPADKSIVIRGKRQDDLDDLYHQKNLSIDQVREILNKPGSGTDAPEIRVGKAPIVRAQAATAPVVQ